MSTQPLFDITSPPADLDHVALLERVRAAGKEARATLGGMEVRLVVDDADARTVLSDRRFVVNAENLPGERNAPTRAEMLRAMGLRPELIAHITQGLLDKDGVDHVRLRKLVSRTFTVRRTEAMRPRIRAIAGELVAALPGHAEGGSVDLLDHFAYPLPIAVICDLLGVPEEERGPWREWGHTLTSFSFSGPEHMNTTVGALVDASRDLIALHRAEEYDDLLGDLVRVRDEDGDRLSEEELITMVITLVIAGHETTANLVANGMHALLTHPDQLELLRSDPDLMPSAVHEMLRWCGPVFQTRPRYAVEDVELSTTTVPAGTPVIAMGPGANRDPGAHPEPHRFDITRHRGEPGEAHLAFGHGLHYCLGAALARAEGQEAVSALLAAFPGLALDPQRPPARQPNLAFVRFQDLYVRL
ncbi:Cytochrome P450 monooxygenase PikC [Nocardiopsis dassonvillei]|uniref:cytochrome P450 family protein n=1 Tax=Nocardiopsis dassonvillei TaxID=2014 RepID=UPI003F57C85B